MPPSFWIVPTGRTLTSAWIETVLSELRMLNIPVALSRVRGLKHEIINLLEGFRLSHSHECVD